jgi:hypothetical protein
MYYKHKQLILLFHYQLVFFENTPTCHERTLSIKETCHYCTFKEF